MENVKIGIKNQATLRQHQKQNRKYALYAIAISLVVTVTAGTALTVNTFKEIKADHTQVVLEGENKYFASYLIKEDETLSDIASRYLPCSGYQHLDDYAREICQINHLDAISKDMIKSGEYLILPYVSKYNDINIALENKMADSILTLQNGQDLSEIETPKIK